jgi:hypothetical protein
MLFLWLLGVRALTEEEQLYIRLCRLGKYFSTEEEICTYIWSDLIRALELLKCIPFRACCIPSYASMRFIMHSCNRCTRRSDTPRVRGSDSGGGSGAAGRTQRGSQRRKCHWRVTGVSGSSPVLVPERQAPVHVDPFVLYINLEYFYLFTALSCRSYVKTLVALYLSWLKHWVVC